MIFQILLADVKYLFAVCSLWVSQVCYLTYFSHYMQHLILFIDRNVPLLPLQQFLKASLFTNSLNLH